MPIRILVVDDSVAVRRAISDALSSDADLEVVGTAANGALGLAKIAQLSPDIVTLDIEMPEMDGLQTLVELRKRYPRLPVIMFSTLTERGGTATLDALARGASDYVTKPSNAGSMAQAQAQVRAELIPRIKALTASGRRLPHTSAPAAASPAVPMPGPKVAIAMPARPLLPIRADVVAIGVSTGGPNALADVIPRLPADFPLPVLIVQHMPPVFTRLLAERLAATSKVQVKEGVEGGVVEPGTVWIAPGNQHMLLRRDGTDVRLVLNSDPPENSCRPAVDPLFRSVAQLYGNRALGVILTGMGYDGLKGAELLRQAGSRVLAQDEATSVVWGMPGAVVQGGLADRVLPLNAVAPELVQLASVGRVAQLPPSSFAEAGPGRRRP
jgi:two-component system chemotaxis response regulator CheB